MSLWIHIIIREKPLDMLSVRNAFQFQYSQYRIESFESFLRKEWMDRSSKTKRAPSSIKRHSRLQGWFPDTTWSLLFDLLIKSTKSSVSGNRRSRGEVGREMIKRNAPLTCYGHPKAYKARIVVAEPKVIEMFPIFQETEAFLIFYGLNSYFINLSFSSK